MSQDFAAQVKAWANLEPYNAGNLSNREILEDTVTSMVTVLSLLRPYVVHKAPPIDIGLLTELVATTQTNVRWLKTILERSPKQKPVAHGKPKVKMEEVLPY